MAHRVTLIPGDGIGPEVSAAVVRIIAAAGVAIEWEEHHAGVTAVEQSGSTLPQSLLDSVLANRIALKGPVTTPVGEGFTSVNVGLRKALDLYANLRPVTNLPGVPSRFQPSNRQGPTNSTQQSAAPTGSLPQPFIRRSMPLR